MLCNGCRSSLLARVPLGAPNVSTTYAILCTGASVSASASRPVSVSGYGRARPYSTPSPAPAAAAATTAVGNSASTSAYTAGSAAAATPPPVRSSVPAGTRLTGLGYTKTVPDVFAKEDEAYPAWLWALVPESSGGTGGSDATGKAAANDGLTAADLKDMTKQQRKRHDKKMAAIAAATPPSVPLHEQAIDIAPPPKSAGAGAGAPGQDAPPALDKESQVIAQARATTEAVLDIRKSSRAARRKGIREDNFLRGM